MGRKKRGHFCWCCRRRRPNERFSGRNHPRHLCRECARLPAEERAYRQAERNIERLLHDGFYVPRRRRSQFERFLEHPNARVRDLARGILAEQQRDAEARRRMRDEDEAFAERLEGGIGAPEGGRTTGEEPYPLRDHGDDNPF